MRGVLLILKHLYFCRTVSRVTITIGLIFAGLGFLFDFYLGETTHFAHVGLMIAVLLPILMAPGTFRSLITNPHLFFVPNFHLCCGIALLAITIFPMLIVVTLPSNSSPVLSAVTIFTFVSFYFAYIQIAITSRYIVALFALPILFVFFSGAILEIMFEEMGNYSVPYKELILIAFFVVVLGWVIALFRLQKSVSFKSAVDPTSVFRASRLKSWLTNRSGKKLSDQLNKKTSKISLLVGYPVEQPSRLGLSIKTVIWIPLCQCAILLMIHFFGDGFAGMEQALEYFLDFFLVFSVLCSIAIVSQQSELVVRMKLIWLKHSGNRSEFWRILEINTLKNLEYFYLIATLVFISMLAMGVPARVCIIYLSAFICSTLFSAYFSLSIRSNKVSALDIFLVVSLFIALAVGGYAGEIGIIPAVEVVLLFFAAVFRYKAKYGFLGIDWCMKKPKPQVAL